MTEDHEAVLLEISAAHGGTCVLTRTRRRDHLLVVSPSVKRSRRVWIGACVGAALVALAVAAFASTLGSYRGPDGLSLTRSDLIWPTVFCVAPIGALLGYLIARRTVPPRTPGFTATISTTLTIDGLPIGALSRVDADVLTRSVASSARAAT